MEEDIALGRRLASICKRMNMKTFAEVLNSERGVGYIWDGTKVVPWRNIEATLFAFHGYIKAGGSIDFGEDDEIPIRKPNRTENA